MINVTIFNEFLHEQTDEGTKKVYPNGIHRAIADFLSCDDITVKCYTLDTVNDITDEVLDNTDVLMWWAHIGHEMVPDEVAVRVQKAVLKGMGMIFLHSSHYSKPFQLLMGTQCSLGWRDEGDMERLWVTDPSHPIVKGIDRYFELEHDEVYCEPFAIPEPDKLLLVGWYEGGEVFRSGCLYQRGFGKVFYFQPGHETYPTFYNKDVQTVLTNAVRYLAPTYRTTDLPCPHIKQINK